MPKLIFLGTSASIPSCQRDNTSLCIQHNKRTILIDCSGSIVQKLYHIGINFRDIREVVITHQHVDHYYSLFHLIHAQCYLNKRMTIYTNAITIRLLKKLLKGMNLIRSHYPKVVFKNISSKKRFYSSGSFTLHAIKNNHIDGSFGIEISSRNKRIIYSSDTTPTQTIIKRAKNCDYLIHDCTASAAYFKKYPRLSQFHTNSRDLARIFCQLNIKKIIPIHFLLLRKGEEQYIN